VRTPLRYSTASSGIARKVFLLRHDDCHLLPRGNSSTYNSSNSQGLQDSQEERADIGGEGKPMTWGKEKKDLSKSVEVRVFPKGKIESITIGGATIERTTFEPGWQWSRSVQPVAKRTSSDAPHFQFHVAGTMKVVMDDGLVHLCKPGAVSLLPSGRDAWVVGSENVVIVDLHGVMGYAMGYALKAG